MSDNTSAPRRGAIFVRVCLSILTPLMWLVAALLPPAPNEAFARLETSPELYSNCAAIFVSAVLIGVWGYRHDALDEAEHRRLTRP